MMEFSVIIPTYNRAKFISRAILSVADQDCVNKATIEIIVIDDGSSDDTEAVVNSVRGRANPCVIRYVRVPHSGQPGTTRNVGLNMVTGRYVAYCDSDDFWLPHHLATAAQYLKREPSLAMLMTFWGFGKFKLHGDGRIETAYIVPQHPNTAVNTNCRIHKRECIDWVGQFNESRWGEDQDFFDRITNGYDTKKVLIVTNVNGYIVGGNNLTYEFDPGIKRAFFNG